MKELEVFAFDAMRRLDTVESEMGVARDFFALAITYVGGIPDEMDSNVFFELLFAFIENWQKSLVKKQKELKEQQQLAIAVNQVNSKKATAPEKSLIPTFKPKFLKETDNGDESNGKKESRSSAKNSQSRSQIANQLKSMFILKKERRQKNPDVIVDPTDEHRNELQRNNFETQGKRAAAWLRRPSLFGPPGNPIIS